MEHRERARKILNHQEADRPAIDLGSTLMTGISAWIYQELKQALGINSGHVRVYDLFQMLAEVETPVLDALGGDFIMLPQTELPLNLSYDGWKEFTFWSGQTMEVPKDFSPDIKDDGSLEAVWKRNEKGDWRMRMPNGGRYFDLIPDTSEDLMNPSLLPEAEWKFTKSYSEEFLRQEEEKARMLYYSTDRALVASPPIGVPQGYGDFLSWAMLMSLEPDHCKNYMAESAEAKSSCMEEYVQAVGKYIDVIVVSAVDFGTQDREAFQPEHFNDIYVDPWLSVTDIIHEISEAKTWIHSCGSIPGMIPLFIKAGIDCLNPVQWTASGMELKQLKKQYGNRLTFWGGAANSQQTFPFGTPQEVVEETNYVLSLMSKGGGYVVNNIHNILSDVPVDNIIAMYQTAQKYRY